MRLFTPLLVVACGLGVATPAFANWQYAKWGMTPSEVLSASGGKAGPAKEGKGLETTYVAGRYSFSGAFGFSSGSGRLERVTLTLSDKANCGFLGGALFSKYGLPISDPKDTAFRLAVWQVPSTNTQVTFFHVLPNGSCTLSYSAMVNEDNEGL